MATTTFLQALRPLAAVLTTLLLAACGGGGDGGGSDDSFTGSPNGYLGILSVAGGTELGGTLLLTPVAGGTTASGSLITVAGGAVPLAGSYSGNGFTLTGGGYAIAATAGSGGLTGTGTAPGGLQATLSVPAAPPTTAPPPADPSGTYKGSFRIDTVLRFRNTLANGTVTVDCTNIVVITGSLTMEIQNKGGGQVLAHLIAATVETTTPGTCLGSQTNTLAIPFSGLDFQGTGASLQLGRVNSGPGGGDGRGTITRLEAFSGAISGNTIVGTVWRSFNFTTPVFNAGETHVESFPMSGATVILTRQ
jgi:hypothetical protein